MKNFGLFVLCFFTILFVVPLTEGCKNEPPVVPPQATLALTAVDASCIEAWLKVTATEVPATVRLVRDGQPVSVSRLLSPDTLLIDEGLLPSRTYTYQLHKLAAGSASGGDSTVIETSASVQVTTMDTTSHNFTWQIDTLGDGGSSVLYDVAIINDTLAYAVGEIYRRDSLGNWDPNAYNLVKWDGNSWELMRIRTSSPCNPVEYSPLKAIWAFADTNILVTSGGSFGWYNGRSNVPDCRMNQLLNGAINRIYATSPQDIYAVGNAGTIVQYNGSTWRQLESGTSIDLIDVHGSSNGSVVWTCGYDRHGPATVLLRAAGENWQVAYDGTAARAQIRTDSLSGAYTSVYVPSAHRVFVGSSAGVYSSPLFTRGEGKRLSFSPTWFPGFPNRLRGTGFNDLIIVGDYNFIAHFNGITWRYFENLGTTDIVLLSVAQRADLVFAVGYRRDPIDGLGIVLRGRR